MSLRSWSRAGLLVRRLAIASAIALAVSSNAAAHGSPSLLVRAVLAPLPAALEDVAVEIHETLGTQLVLENRTGRPIEILDERGVPFVRIGSDQVEGNLNARAWHATQGPAAIVPTSARGGAPRWQRARGEPTFGWFDPRVDASHVEVPHALQDAGREADVGSWRIPLRVAGRPTALSGTFRYVPRPTGAYRARLTSPQEIAAGVRVKLLPGRVPGLLLENRSGRTLTVLGVEGEPFLRMDPAGVEANVRSSTWRRSARTSAAHRVVDRASSSDPAWARVAAVPRFGWIEPRAAIPEPSDRADRSAAAMSSSAQWEVPMELGDEPLRVEGVVEWKAATVAASASSARD